MIKIVEKNIKELIPYDNNPRINEEAIEFVANSIKEFGFKNPCIIDKNNIIVCGHTRVLACKKLGIDRVPCIIADDLTEEQIKAFRIADNSTAQIAEWDIEKLIKEINGIEFDLSDFGLKEQLEQIEEEVDALRDAEEDNYIPPEDLPIKIKRGEIWELGRHRLMCGDSTSREDVTRLMNNNLADLVITDPPYNVDYKGQNKMKIENDNLEDGEFQEFLLKAFENLSNNLKKGGSFYIWFASRNHIPFEKALILNGLSVREELIWVKNALVLGRQDYQWRHEPCLYGWKDGGTHYFVKDRRQTTVFDNDFNIDNLTIEELKQIIVDLYEQNTIIYENKPLSSKLHPTMKPINLIGRLIKNSSKTNELVLDLFAGSGSTLIACEQLERNAYVMEFDEKYANVIIDRWEKLTGKKAKKII